MRQGVSSLPMNRHWDIKPARRLRVEILCFDQHSACKDSRVRACSPIYQHLEPPNLSEPPKQSVNSDIVRIMSKPETQILLHNLIRCWTTVAMGSIQSMLRIINLMQLLVSSCWPIQHHPGIPPRTTVAAFLWVNPDNHHLRLRRKYWIETIRCWTNRWISTSLPL